MQHNAELSLEYGQSVSVQCGTHGGKNHFSAALGPKAVVSHRCDRPDSLRDQDGGAELRCTPCAEVRGCAVPETCTTDTDSRCGNCSALAGQTDKRAYRLTGGDPDTADVCAQCGGNVCGRGKEVSVFGWVAYYEVES